MVVPGQDRLNALRVQRVDVVHQFEVVLRCTDPGARADAELLGHDIDQAQRAFYIGIVRLHQRPYVVVLAVDLDFRVRLSRANRCEQGGELVLFRFKRS